MGPGLYVHIPFCKRRCGYCDFYVEVRAGGVRERAVEAILREAEFRMSRWTHGPFHSVFLGGGTPSHLGADLLGRLLSGLTERLAVDPSAEWTMEANPESASPAVLESARRHGVNRLSLGIQSFDDPELAELDRLHDARGAREAFRRARGAGFENVNVDLIYGLPAPRHERPWEETLREATALEPDHISCYLLTLEARVPMGRALAAGRIRLPSDGAARRQYEQARHLLEEAGYEHYEISNWARPRQRCRHNVNVWQGGVYMGLGPGAHGHQAGARRANLPDLSAYLEALEAGRDAPHEESPVDPQARREERLFLGLRLREGLAWDEIAGDLGADGAARLRQRASRWTRRGFLEDDGVRLRLAEKGLFVSNRLVAELLEAL